MSFETKKSRCKGMSVAMFLLLLGGCATSPEFETPPRMPQNLLPVHDSDLRNGVEITFSWRSVALAVDYEFHIFDRSSGASVNQRVRINPDKACVDSICTIVETLDMPILKYHAWRVRAVNPAGQSGWSRSLFNVVQ